MKIQQKWLTRVTFCFCVLDNHISAQEKQVILSFATVTLHIVQNSKVHVDFYFKSDYMQNYFGGRL